jgi:hypothetical protein
VPTFWEQWRVPDSITRYDGDVDAEWLPPVLLIMEIYWAHCINTETECFGGYECE